MSAFFMSSRRKTIKVVIPPASPELQRGERKREPGEFSIVIPAKAWIQKEKPGSRVPPLARLAQKGGGARDDIAFAGMTKEKIFRKIWIAERSYI